MIEDLLVQGTRWGPKYLSDIELKKYNPVKQRAGSNVLYQKNPEDILKMCDSNGCFRIERENMCVLKIVDDGKEIPFNDYTRPLSKTFK